MERSDRHARQVEAIPERYSWPSPKAAAHVRSRMLRRAMYGLGCVPDGQLVSQSLRTVVLGGLQITGQGYLAAGGFLGVCGSSILFFLCKDGCLGAGSDYVAGMDAL